MHRQLVALLVGVSLLAGAGLTVSVAADHGSPSNFTVVPHDRAPGNGDATYQQHAVSPITFQRLDSIRATYQAGGFEGCGATNAKVFGIDRDDDDPGTQTDHDLTQNAKKTQIEKHTFYVEFYDEDDLGSSTNFDEGDEFVTLTENCFDNPSEPGWYQIESTITGTASNGSEIEASDVSHYFYICECSNEQEARDQLGPPPSEPEPTATPTATPEPTPTRTPPDEGTPFPSPTPTATSTATDTPMEASAQADSTDTDRSTAASTPDTATATEADWDEIAKETPTVGSGPGFGPAIGILAFALCGLLALRRR